MHKTYWVLQMRSACVVQVEKAYLNELRDAKAALNKQLALVGSVKQVQPAANLVYHYSIMPLVHNVLLCACVMLVLAAAWLPAICTNYASASLDNSYSILHLLTR